MRSCAATATTPIRTTRRQKHEDNVVSCYVFIKFYQICMNFQNFLRTLDLTNHRTEWVSHYAHCLAAQAPTPKFCPHTVSIQVAVLDRFIASLVDLPSPYRPKTQLWADMGVSADFWARLDLVSVIWPGKRIQAATQTPQKPAYIAVGEADGGQTPCSPPPLRLPPTTNCGPACEQSAPQRKSSNPTSRQRRWWRGTTPTDAGAARLVAAEAPPLLPPARRQRRTRSAE
jgi:hypothetical protein